MPASAREPARSGARSSLCPGPRSASSGSAKRRRSAPHCSGRGSAAAQAVGQGGRRRLRRCRRRWACPWWMRRPRTRTTGGSCGRAGSGSSDGWGRGGGGGPSSSVRRASWCVHLSSLSRPARGAELTRVPCRSGFGAACRFRFRIRTRSSRPGVRPRSLSSPSAGAHTDADTPADIPWTPPTDPPTSRFESLLVRLPWLHSPAVSAYALAPPPHLRVDEPLVVQLVPRRRQDEGVELASPVQERQPGPALLGKEGEVGPPAPEPVLPVDANFYFFLVCCA